MTDHQYHRPTLDKVALKTFVYDPLRCMHIQRGKDLEKRRSVTSERMV